MTSEPLPLSTEVWPLGRLVEYKWNPRHNDAAVDRMCASIREFGFKIPCLARSGGELVDGHLRLKAARKLGLKEIPVILCNEWTPAQVKAFRLLVNRSATWAGWDLELLAQELQALKHAKYDLSLTGFDVAELDELLRSEPAVVDTAKAAPPAPKVPVSQAGDLWWLGPHRVLCGDATSSHDVAVLLGYKKPRLMVTDSPSGDTRADWSEAFALASSLEVAYVWHAPEFTREVLDGLLRIGFENQEQIIWDKCGGAGAAAETAPSGGGSIGGESRDSNKSTHYGVRHEPCWYVRKKDAPWFGKAGEDSTIWIWPSANSTQRPVELMRKPIVNHLRCGEVVYDPFLGSGTTLAAAELTERVCYGMEVDPRYVDVAVQRWQRLTGKQARHDMGGVSFDDVARGRGSARRHTNWADGDD